MPNNAYTAAAKEAYAAAKSDETELETLDIYHPDVGHFYLVRDMQDGIFTLEDSSVVTFEAVGFKFKRPKSDSEGLQELALSIDNVDQRIGDFLKAAKESTQAVTVTWRPYLASDKTTPLMNPPLVLYLTDVRITDLEVSGKATFADIINMKFPNGPASHYTRVRFPSLSN
jgi:hypothetical protein